MDISGLIPSIGGSVFTVVAFIVALSVIVAIHEYGHYIVGRWSGIHADVFSLGFGPVLWSGHDKRGTKWQIAALPFGGYVKFKGDADAASGKDGDAMEGLDAAELRSTMHGAPLWARSATVAAGPLFNFILSFLIFAALLSSGGKAIEPLTIAELRGHPMAEESLRVGDKLLEINNTAVPPLASFGDFLAGLPTDVVLPYKIRRDGAVLDVTAPYPFPPAIVSIQPRSAAIDAGLKLGDVITAVDGAPIATFGQLQDVIRAAEGAAVDLSVWRAGETLEKTLTPRLRDLPAADGGFETRWLIGINGGMLFEPATEGVGVLDSLWGGVQQTGLIIQSSLSGLYHIASGGISACNISGPIGIAQSSGAMASQGLETFIWFIAVLSTAVGMLNLFPIPVLDGGHLVFHAYEAITGRPPSDKALKFLMTIGLTLLLLLMVFAVSNDLTCV